MTEYLHRLNAEWTTATRRVSPRILVHWLEATGEELADLFESLDPFGRAVFPVAWAGEEESPNWFDVAREYTEKWHHTQQIFEAVGKPSTITIRRLFHPCLDTFLRALPFTYRHVRADSGTAVAVTIRGEAGGGLVHCDGGRRLEGGGAAKGPPEGDGIPRPRCHLEAVHEED